MKTALVPTDFSPASEKTIRFILSFLQSDQIRCRVILLNTYLVPQASPHQLIKINDEMKQKFKESLQAQLRWAEKLINKDNIVLETLSYMGTLKNVLTPVTQEKGVDFVMMGMEGPEKRSEVLGLLNQTPCPIFLIPSDSSLVKS